MWVERIVGGGAMTGARTLGRRRPASERSRSKFDRGTHPISLRFSKSGAHGWILHCSADIARELKEALDMKLNDSRASVLFQLAIQGCQNIGGSVNVKTQGEKGFVIFNCPA